MNFTEQEEQEFDEIYYNELGMCGCGMPEDVKTFLFDLLENHRKYTKKEIEYHEMSEKKQEIIKSINSDVIFEIIFHIFEKAELIAHGSSVYGSWFTEKGFKFLYLLEKFKDEE